MHTLKVISIALATVLLVGRCIAQTQHDGNFVGIFTLERADSSAVKKEVSIECRKSSNHFYNVSIFVLWEPGAEVEIDTEKAEFINGTLAFSFTDSFGNKGKATFKVQGDLGELVLESTEVVESRAARQYGSYKLRKQAVEK